MFATVRLSAEERPGWNFQIFSEHARLEFPDFFRTCQAGISRFFQNMPGWNLKIRPNLESGYRKAIHCTAFMNASMIANKSVSWLGWKKLRTTPGWECGPTFFGTRQYSRSEITQRPACCWLKKKWIMCCGNTGTVEWLFNRSWIMYMALHYTWLYIQSCAWHYIIHDYTYNHVHGITLYMTIHTIMYMALHYTWLYIQSCTWHYIIHDYTYNHVHESWLYIMEVLHHSSSFLLQHSWKENTCISAV